MILTQAYKAIEKQDTQAFNALMDRVYGKPVVTENVALVTEKTKEERDAIVRAAIEA